MSKRAGDDRIPRVPRGEMKKTLKRALDDKTIKKFIVVRNTDGSFDVIVKYY